MQTAYPNTYYHITSIHKKKKKKKHNGEHPICCVFRIIYTFDVDDNDDEAVADTDATNCAVSLPLFFFLSCFFFACSLSHPL